MLRLAGQEADGVLLNYLPVSHVSWCVEQVRRGGNATIYANIHVGVLMTLTGADEPPAAGTVRVVALGDSITKGVRTGVRPEETFAVLVERALKADGIGAELINLGIGGERTDQALKRLDAVFEQKPRVVTVMYGTNDSYVDRGATASRISVPPCSMWATPVTSSLR